MLFEDGVTEVHRMEWEPTFKGRAIEASEKFFYLDAGNSDSLYTVYKRWIWKHVGL